MPNKQVLKALSQEDMTILGNIKSLIDEMMSMSQQAPAGDQTNQPAPPMTAAKAAAEKADPVKKVEVTTPSDAATPDADDAETIIDDKLPEVTDENVDELQRSVADMQKSFQTMIKMMAGKPAPVQKAKNPMVEAFEGIMKVIKDQGEKVDKLTEIYGADLEARGVFKQLEISDKEAKDAEVRKPITNPDANEVIKYLGDILGQVRKGGNETDQKVITPVSSNATKITKNLRDPMVMKHLMSPDALDRLLNTQEGDEE